MTAVETHEQPQTATGPAPLPAPGRGTWAAALLAAVALGLAAGLLAASSAPVGAVVFPALLVPVVVWKRPAWTPLVLLAGVVLIEQYGYEVGPRRGTFTSEIPFFHSVTYGSGVLPAELLLLLAVVVTVMQQVRDGRRLVHWSPLARRVALFGALAFLALVLGVLRGGSLHESVDELRPFAYLVLAYLLAAALLTGRRVPERALWVFVLGCPLKAAYGIVIFWSVRTLEPRPEAVLAHEESYFFGLYMFIVLALWLFGVKGRLRTTASWLLPVVLVADLVNSRRTAWAILMFGCALLLVVAYRALPERRHVLRRVGLVLALLTAVYLPVFWNSGMTIAQPARAIKSEVHPDPRDASSNEYRVLENYNLELNIRGTHSLGKGFGIPIIYSIQIPDITNISSSIDFVPHNGLYWVWFRLGVLGELALWLVVAEAISVAIRLARRGSGHAAVLGAVTASAVMAWIIMGETDLGLFWYRMALCTGLLLGLVEAQTRRLPPPDGTHGWPGLARARAARGWPGRTVPAAAAVPAVVSAAPEDAAP